MAEETTTVQVAEGTLRGKRMESCMGGSFWSFQGIPYARPPVGALRFKDAQPPEPWQGVRDALKEGNNCGQYSMLVNAQMGQDDCLFLNVYTSRLPEEGARDLPVIVFIHGGGFELGSGDYAMCGPDYLLTEDVVFVSINYRVGVLGFLFLGKEAPGNAGLKDQVAALRWVQRNIAAFGGDPGNVTILGTSAGASSVHFQMLSPMSKGLFHKAIAMSGSALSPWAVQTEPEQTARRLAQILGCPPDLDDDAIVNFLRSVDHEVLVRAAHFDAPPTQDKERILKFSFVPTPERIVPGVETFLPAPAEQLMKEGRCHDVPYMTGHTEKEALTLVAFKDFRKEDIAREVDSKWETCVLPETRLPRDGNKHTAALEDMREFFMNGKSLDDDTRDGFVDMLSDLTFNEGVSYALRTAAKSNSAPVYQYIFTVDDELNFVKALFKLDLNGAGHGDDIGYLLRVVFINPDLPPDSSADLIRKRMVRLLTNFVKSGDPTPTDDPLLGVRWKPYTEKERNYLEIGKTMRTGTDLHAERLDFWEKFYAKYSS